MTLLLLLIWWATALRDMGVVDDGSVARRLPVSPTTTRSCCGAGIDLALLAMRFLLLLLLLLFVPF
jgi:hypothetical protein